MSDVIQFVSNDLYNMPVCRLCGENNTKGYALYSLPTNNVESVGECDEYDISILINKYLPLQISDDGKYPRWICPGCHLQVESTAQFFNLIISGQELLRNKYLAQKDEEDIFFNEHIETEDPDFLIDSNMLFSSEHEMTYRMSGIPLRKKKKRGRPPKVNMMDKNDDLSPNTQKPDSDVIQEALKSVDDWFDCDTSEGGRKKRKIRIPSRFLEAVQGKELEKLYINEGVACSDNSDYENSNGGEKCIGQLQSQDGSNWGDLIMDVNGSIQDGKRINTKTKFACDKCQQTYTHFERYMIHRQSHNGASCVGNPIEMNVNDKMVHSENHPKEAVGFTEIENFFNNPLTALELKKVSINTQNLEQTSTTGSQKIEESLGVNITQSNLPVPPLHYTVNIRDMQLGVLSKNSDTPEPDSGGLICDTCQKCFPSMIKLTDHKFIVHNQNQHYVCSTCGKKFKRKIQLQRHFLTHSNARPFECSVCLCKFKLRRSLMNHMATHNAPTSLKCSQCDFRCCQQTLLQKHMRVHTGEKPFVCPYCGKLFSQKSNMTEHVRIHTGERPFGCDVCGVTFTTSSQCASHRKRHTKERPYDCPHCEKTFAKLNIYRIHLRRHNDDRPYACTKCNRSFSESWALRKHLRTHTGEKPYACGKCPKMFSDCSNLAKHKKIHERVNLTTKVTSEIINDIVDDMFSPIIEKTTPVQMQTVEPTTWQLNNDDVFYITYQPQHDNGIASTTELIPSVSSVEETENAILHVTENPNNMVLLSSADTDNLNTAASIFAHTSFSSDLPNSDGNLICDETLLGLPNSAPVIHETINYDDNGQGVEFIIPDGTKFKLIPGFNTNAVDLSELISDV